jgi:hypothetical protein
VRPMVVFSLRFAMGCEDGGDGTQMNTMERR